MVYDIKDIDSLIWELYLEAEKNFSIQEVPDNFMLSEHDGPSEMLKTR